MDTGELKEQILSEIFYTCEFVRYPTREFFQPYVDAHVYHTHGVFLMWYRNPTFEIKDGLVIATAWRGRCPIAVCIVNFSHYNNYGFYTKVAYRRMGLARKLGAMAKSKCEETRDPFTASADYCEEWGSAYKICTDLGIEVEVY